jgi:hypothetical protein
VRPDVHDLVIETTDDPCQRAVVAAVREGFDRRSTD